MFSTKTTKFSLFFINFLGMCFTWVMTLMTFKYPNAYALPYNLMIYTCFIGCLLGSASTFASILDKNK